MTLCTCGHEERHHDNEAGQCDKIGCDCWLFRPDFIDMIGTEESPIEGYGEEEIELREARRHRELVPQLAALTAENATLQMEIEAANIAAGEWEETAAALTAERDSLRALANEIGPYLTFKWPMNQPSDLLMTKLQELLQLATGEQQ